jgi:hypothetical protein
MCDCAWGRRTERERREQDKKTNFVDVSTGVADFALSALQDSLQQVYEC